MSSDEKISCSPRYLPNTFFVPLYVLFAFEMFANDYCNDYGRNNLLLFVVVEVGYLKRLVESRLFIIVPVATVLESKYTLQS